MPTIINNETAEAALAAFRAAHPTLRAAWMVANLDGPAFKPVAGAGGIMASPAAWTALRAIFGLAPQFEPTGTVSMVMPRLTVAEWLTKMDAALTAVRESHLCCAAPGSEAPNTTVPTVG